MLIFFRLLATQASNEAKVKKQSDKDESKVSQSFVMNIFRGQLQTSQLFPYPQNLNEEQLETLKMLIDPVEKFFEVGKKLLIL